MLRTHSELGYKQEQRFHLELGLLKMAHAQRLLPIEQLLSDVAAIPAGNSTRPAVRPSIVGSSAPVPATQRPDSARPNYVSPFAADSARKGTPRQDASTNPAPAGPRIVAAASSPEPVIMGAAAPATQREIIPQSDPSPNRRDVASHVSADRTKPSPPEPAFSPESSSTGSIAQPQIEPLQAAVLQALTDGNQRILASMLEAGEWSVQANELVIKVAESQTIVDMSLGSEARRLATASASGLLGRAIKLKIVPGTAVAPQEAKRNGAAARPSSPSATGRSRAEQDVVVRRLQQKFGAEIRTVIDHKEKR